MDAREVSRGDQVHGFFSVALEPGDGGKPFKLIELSELGKQKTIHSYLMSKPTGEIAVDAVTQVSYRVLEDHGADQVIEVKDADDDKTLWSRYRATKSEVAPISSRAMRFDYMFGAFPYAFAVALAVYLLGGFLKRRNDQIVQGAS